MIDLVNFVIGVSAGFVLGLVWRDEDRRGWIGALAAFVIGVCFHSTLLHEQIRQGWTFIWDHANLKPSTNNP